MAARKFNVGDLVRFKDSGKIDWEVIYAQFHVGVGQHQKLTLKSGMSDRLMRTTSEHVITRTEALNAK